MDPLGLKGEREIYDAIQRISDDVEGMSNKQLGLEASASARQVGTAKHKVFQDRVEVLNNTIGKGRIVTEGSIDRLGDLADFGEKYSRRPDVILLKEGETLEAAMKAGLTGKIHSVVDLKTGGAHMTDGWADDVAARLGVGRHLVQEVKAGEQLGSKFSSAAARMGAATSRVGRKLLGPVTATTFVALAFNEAKAAGMSNRDAAAYAAASIAGGDVIYDGMNAAGNMAWARANAFARSSAGGRYINNINQEVFGSGSGAGTVPGYLQGDAALDAILDSHSRGIGGRGY